ncbi:MAG: UbiX family flavin prenyltransferase [Thermoplasmata archaeon]|nr:UbiX family flavin prenyltransferase [Thermoplasmata archaeon]
MKITLAITGASGVIYGIRLLEEINEKHDVYLIISSNAKKIMEHETSYTLEEMESMAYRVYEEDEIDASIASGSSDCNAMVIAPCSLKTLSAIANGFAFNLISRTAMCCLKEGKKLIVVPRETPLDSITLENMLKLHAAGATILPAMPAFYHMPDKIDDLVNYIVGKIMEQLGLKHNLYRKWKS